MSEEKILKSDTQARKWQITIENPHKYDMEHESIHKRLKNFKSLVYACMCDETGEKGTYHTHIFFCCSSSIIGDKSSFFMDYMRDEIKTLLASLFYLLLIFDNLFVKFSWEIKNENDNILYYLNKK